MKNRLFSAFLLATLFLQVATLSAQNAQAAIYVLYSSANMDLLDYRTAYSNTSATYYAYALKNAGGSDRFLIYTGNGTYTENLPQGTVGSRDFRLTDEVRDAVNRFTRQLFVVNQLQRGFSVVPVTSITRVTKSGNFYLVNAPDYSFVFDTANLTMGRELAQPGSRSSVSLISFGVKNCRNYYTFRRTPQQTGQEASEFEFIPSIGVSMQRSGRTASEMQANQVSLWGVNSLALDDYIQRSCGGQQQSLTGAVLPPPPTGGTSTGYEPRLGDPATGNTIATPVGGMGVVSALSGQPVVNCPVSARPGYHVVQPKETLSAIARWYGVTNQQILTWNKIKDANKITVCQELRIAPPGATVQQPKGPALPTGTTTVLQQQKGTSVQQVTLPPQQPAQQPQYQPAQAAPSTELPDLFNTGGAPLAYSTPQPQYQLANTQQATAPAVYNAQPATPNSWQYHTVQTGESVYALATRYGYTQERLRRMNGFPATGDIPLQYGQQIKISDCTCPPGGTSSVTPVISTPATGTTTSPVVYSTPTTTPAAGMLKIPTQPAVTAPTLPAANTGTQFVPLGNNSTVSGASPVATTPEQPKVNKREPLSFRDYYVKDSESIRDIARKERLDPTELGLINGRDPNEVLPPGTRVQIPIY